MLDNFTGDWAYPCLVSANAKVAGQTNARVYSNPGTYVWCLYMHGLFDLTGAGVPRPSRRFYGSQFHRGIARITLRKHRFARTRTIFTGHRRFLLTTRVVLGRKRYPSPHSVMPNALSGVSSRGTWLSSSSSMFIFSMIPTWLYPIIIRPYP